MNSLRIHLFARARDLAGASLLELSIEPGTTVGQLRQILAQQVPNLEPILARCAIAINQDFAEDDRVLTAGCEIAVIPPVSGGTSGG